MSNPDEILSRQLSRIEAEANGAGPSRDGADRGDTGLRWRRLSEIEARPIVFADKPIWQESAFHLLVGRKNSGKGTWLAREAARITRGELGGRRNVIWIASGEDSLSIDVRPRIEVAGGDVARVTVLEHGRLVLPDHAAALREVAKDVGDVGLIVIDPVGASLAAGMRSNHDGDVRPALSCLNDLADDLGCMVAGVRHLTNKEIKGDAIAGVLGSSDWVNVPRVVLALVKDDKDDDLRHLTILTGNRVKGGAGRLYRIEGVAPPHGGEDVTRAVLVGDSNRSADDLLNGGSSPESKSERGRAAILDALEAAPNMTMESDELDALVSDQCGLAAGTVRNLRTKLRDRGFIRFASEKRSDGTHKCWWVIRTNAPRG